MMNTTAGIALRVLRARLAEWQYDVGFEGEDETLAWALRWFCAKNALDEHDDEDIAERLLSREAARGFEPPFQVYSMRDPLWAEHPYKAAHTTVKETISTSGCGPTSMAMAVSTLLGKAVLPPTLADWSNAHHHRDPEGIDGTYDSFFPACADRYGLRAERYDMEGERSFDIIREALAKGGVVITNVKSTSPYTKGGHFNLVREMRGDYVHIGDPSPANLDKPDYTVADWIGGRWATHFFIISKP